MVLQKKSEDYIVKRFSKNMTYCIGRIFSTTNINQKKLLDARFKEKIKKANNKIILENLNHYRDFISMKDISKNILFFTKI